MTNEGRSRCSPPRSWCSRAPSASSPWIWHELWRRRLARRRPRTRRPWQRPRSLRWTPTRARRKPPTTRLEICDAHPELIRAAKYLGEQATRPCPVCKGDELRLLAYVYADGLRRNNGRAFEVGEALAIAAGQQGGACYVVEVCTGCC